MPYSLDRRSFLQRSAVLGGSLLTCSIPLDRSAHAAPVRIEMNVFYSAIHVATRGRVSCSAGLMISGRVGDP
jgi:hypothetical protein